MTQILPLEEGVLRAVSNILGDTVNGLTENEVSQMLRGCGMDDPLEGEPLRGGSRTMRERIYEALNKRQCQDGTANQIAVFLSRVMQPARYVDKLHDFEYRRVRLNRPLASAGLKVMPDGTMIQIAPVTILSDAQERAERLYRSLLTRKAHPDVLRVCKDELLPGDYFQVVLEAAKSIADKIRTKADLSSDGSKLIEDAFGGDFPLLAFNSLQTEAERSEHAGITNLLRDFLGSFQNTTTRAAAIYWGIDEQAAIEMLAFISLLHHRLDSCFRTRNKQIPVTHTVVEYMPVLFAVLQIKDLVAMAGLLLPVS